jgi:hypothetical protein
VESAIDHETQWKNLLQQDEGLKAVLAAVEKPRGKALVISHDDPDGITSGLILKRTLAKKGWKPVLLLPEGFVLQPDQFEKALRDHPDAQAVFMSDKGTLPVYTPFARRLPLFIVDHHPSPTPPEGCAWFNPAAKKYIPASASILAHGIATLAGTRDAFDDFLCLVGLKGDWVVEPVSGVIGDFVKPFFVKYGAAFRGLYKMTAERPTMFDPEQREGTCLLSRVTEFVHATGGGGFSYFYHDRDASLKGVDHAATIASALEKLAPKTDALAGIGALEDFVKLLPSPEADALRKIYGFFLEDWKKAEALLDSSAKALTLADTAIYLFTGGKVPLLPMIGSIKLFALKNAAGDKTAQIVMVSGVSPTYTHVSVRGTGDQVHSGKFCGRLAARLQERFPAEKDKISGGGHPRAAECVARTAAVPLRVMLAHVVEQLNEMAEADRLMREAEDGTDHRARAAELGLDYAAK